MSTAAERLRLITELVQSQSSTLELAESINAYLAGQGTLDDVRATLATQERVFAPIYPAWQEAAKLKSEAERSGPLDELDLRLLAVYPVLDSNPEILRFLTTSEQKQQALEFLRQNCFEPRTLLVGIHLTINHAFDENGQLTPFGEYLLPLVQDTIDALIAQHDPDSQIWRWPHAWDYTPMLRLLLAANPSDLERVWAIIYHSQEGLNPTIFVGEYARLLLQADPERATRWLRNIAQLPRDARARTTALNLLMQRDPASHVDLAVEIARSPLPAYGWGEFELHLTALHAAYHFDPVAYFPLIEEAALGQQAQIAFRVVHDLSANTDEQTRQLLQRCVTSGVLQAAERALQALQGQQWEGKLDFMLSLLTHRFSSIRKEAWTWLAYQGDASLDPLTSLLADRSAAIRQSAAQTLGQIGSERAAVLLAARLDNEKSAKIRQAIAVILDDLRAADHRTLSREAVLEKAEWLHRYAPQPALDWFNPEEAPALHWTTGMLAPPVVLGYLLHRQLRPHPPGTLEDYARRMLALLDHNTSGDLALALFNGWLNNSARAKDIRVVPLACALGDDRLVALLQHTVESWQKGSRFSLALIILYAMRLMEAPSLQSTLKDLAKRLRRLKLKRAAKDALAAVQP